MYHHVRPIDFRRSDSFTSDLTLPPPEFERQLRYLRDRGFHAATMAELSEHLQGRKRLPERSVVLTFDDGYMDNYLYAFPALARQGFSGTFYIITGLVGMPGYMNWPHLRELLAGGMEIGAHSQTHPDLAAWLDQRQREREIFDSKLALEKALGVRVQSFSYSSGSFNPQVVEVTRRAGYSTAVTTRYGANLDGRKMLEMPRVRIHGTEPLSLFQWRIEQYFPLGEPALR